MLGYLWPGIAEEAMSQRGKGGKVPVITETIIQNALYRHLRFDRGFVLIYPNMTTITNYEADMIAVSKAGYAYEWEIKVSLSDFRADLKKREKHASLSGAVRKIQSPYAYYKNTEIHVRADAPENPFDATRYQCFPDCRPKEFWYLIHGFDIPDGELPAYAGLMKFVEKDRGRRVFEIITPAPKLETQKVDEKKIVRATSNMLYRYWELRRNGSYENPELLQTKE